eukprot:285683_1
MFTMSVLLTILINIAFAQWIAPNAPKLPRSCEGSAIGVYNNSIFILGARSGGPTRQLVEYHITNNEMVDHGEYFLLDNTWGSGQSYTQIDNRIFMIPPVAGNNPINVFLLDSKVFIESYQNITIPVPVSDQACLASTANRLFISGGWKIGPGFIADVQVLDIFSMEWLDNVPSLQRVRGDHCCIV